MAEIIFRQIEKEDLSLIQRWRNHDNVMPYCRQYRPLSVGDMNKWYETLTKDKDYNLINDLFVIELNGDPIGVCGLVRIDWRNRKGELSFYIANIEKNTEEIIKKSLLEILGYAFKTLNLWKVYWPVFSFNPYLPIYEKFMKREYVARKEYFWNGKYHDRIVLVAYEST